MFIKSTKWKLKQLHVYILITDNYQLQFNVNIQRNYNNYFTHGINQDKIQLSKTTIYTSKSNE